MQLRVGPLVVLAVAAALALVVAGCGGKSYDELVSCRAESINAAAYDVVTKAYYEGKLGPRSRVEKELGPDADQFFDANGRFRPYSSFTGPQRSKINHWMYQNGRVLSKTLREQDRAKNAAASADADARRGDDRRGLAARSGLRRGKSEAEQSACRGDYVNSAGWRVVTAAYEEGTLGSRATVERQLGHDAGGLFDADGHFKPYRALTARQKAQANEWMRSDRVQGKTLADQDRAMTRAAVRVDDVC
jgi:hypothetical protein